MEVHTHGGVKRATPGATEVPHSIAVHGAHAVVASAHFHSVRVADRLQRLQGVGAPDAFFCAVLATRHGMCSTVLNDLHLHTYSRACLLHVSLHKSRFAAPNCLQYQSVSH